MTKKGFLTFVLACCSVFCSSAFGNTTALYNNYPSDLWQLTASFGYTHFQDAYGNDGDAETGRIALGVNPFSTYYSTLYTNYGLELGLQNGNNMKLDIPQSTLDSMGGVQIKGTIKPIVDLLATIKISPTTINSNLFIMIKGGAAYRRMQFDRDTVANKTRISGELQAGIGYNICRHVNLILYYQGIYNGQLNFKVDPNVTDMDLATGSVSNIPNQNSGFFGVEIFL